MTERSQRGLKLRFKQTEIERAIRGVQKRGLDIGKIEIDPVTSKISITTGKPSTDNSKNPWDTVLAHGDKR